MYMYVNTCALTVTPCEVFLIQTVNSIFLLCRLNLLTFLFLDFSTLGTVSLDNECSHYFSINVTHSDFCPIPLVMDYLKANYEFWNNKSPSNETAD